MIILCTSISAPATIRSLAVEHSILGILMNEIKSSNKRSSLKAVLLCRRSDVGHDADTSNRSN